MPYRAFMTNLFLGNLFTDLDVIHDTYEPTSLSFFDHVFGFFSGVRQRGLQTTEEILREGSFITAVGELELDGNAVRLQPTEFGPMFLTTATKATLIRKFEEARTSMMYVAWNHINIFLRVKILIHIL